MRETVDDIRARVTAAQKNYDDNLRIIEGILYKERGYVFKPPFNEDVMLLCSGGLDSVVSVDMVVRDWSPQLHLTYFRRGARAERYEEQAFDFFVDFYSDRYPDNIADPIKIECEIPSKEVKPYIPEARTLTVGHPLRNSMMLNRTVECVVALNNKLDIGINTILKCSVGEDGTEPELGLLSLRTQNLNTCVQTGNWEWQITSPLTERTLPDRPIYKIHLIKHALENEIPLEKTRTCFSEEETADGTCFACEKRLGAFKHLGLEDPIDYKNVKIEKSE